MGKNFIGNSLSLASIGLAEITFLRVVEVKPEDIPRNLEFRLGHQDITNIVNGILGTELEVNRTDTRLTAADHLYVAQYAGPRLAEDAVGLPEGASIRWLEVTMVAGEIEVDCDFTYSALADWLYGHPWSEEDAQREYDWSQKGGPSE
jgi:hypothetical protein